MTAHAYQPVDKVTPLIFLDTETTGLRPDLHTPWEIAWKTALHDPRNRILTIVDRFSAVVPLYFKEKERADPKALEIGRYAERGQMNMVAREDVIPLLEMACAVVTDLSRTTDKPHLVGAVPSFDHAMLCMNWLGWPGFGEGLWYYHLVDVEVLAAGTLGYPPPYKSDDLTAMLGIKVDEKDKHTAMGDVMWAVQMYAAVYRLTIKETM